MAAVLIGAEERDAAQVGGQRRGSASAGAGIPLHPAPINQLFQSTLVLPQARRSEIRFAVMPDTFHAAGAARWHALFQDA
jgi:hypothetical protein